jgi:hypothetical protein
MRELVGFSFDGLDRDVGAPRGDAADLFACAFEADVYRNGQTWPQTAELGFAPAAQDQRFALHAKQPNAVVDRLHGSHDDATRDDIELRLRRAHELEAKVPWFGPSLRLEGADAIDVGLLRLPLRFRGSRDTAPHDLCASRPQDESAFLPEQLEELARLALKAGVRVLGMLECIASGDRDGQDRVRVATHFAREATCCDAARLLDGFGKLARALAERRSHGLIELGQHQDRVTDAALQAL